MTDTPVKPVDSASIMIIRDGAECHPEYGTLEILMVKRHQNIKFAGGAYVFPGGKVDPADRQAEEADPESHQDDLPQMFRGMRYAALREVFEETGLLIGERNGRLVDEAVRAELDRKYRRKFLENRLDVRTFLAETGLKLSVRDCRPFAHWITPEQYPKRFDTRFFLCMAPEGQVASPDGREAVEVRWVRPLELIEESRGTLMFPTMMNLKKLGRARTVAEALHQLTDNRIVTVKPEIVKGAQGVFRKIREDAGYDDVDQKNTHPGMAHKPVK
tara:strand:+ start:2440 stop:3258 length:819 start_codon:yes stop_codon:yes gene_type:complete